MRQLLVNPGLLYKHPRHSLINYFSDSVIFLSPGLYGDARPKRFEIYLPFIKKNIYKNVAQAQDIPNPERTSKSHNWFNSYGNSAKEVDFVCWWNSLGLCAVCKAGWFNTLRLHQSETSVQKPSRCRQLSPPLLGLLFSQ